MAKAEDYQVHHNGPLTDEAIAFLNTRRIELGFTYKEVGDHLGISGAFAHNILNKKGNITTGTAMQRIAEGIEKLGTIGPDTNARLPSAGSASLTHSYHLRSDLQVTIKLPVDFTEREADRLCLFIRSLTP